MRARDLSERGRPGGTRRGALDAATDGGYTALRDRGLSDDVIQRLADKGNEIRRLADNARLQSRTLDAAEAADVDTAVRKFWPAATPEAVGVENALAQLRKDPNPTASRRASATSRSRPTASRA